MVLDHSKQGKRRFEPGKASIMILLIGPGGAGKTTTGALLAEQFGVRFVDLDAQFMTSFGDISNYIHLHGYLAYAARNVEVYVSILKNAESEIHVVACSSGFMGYSTDIHPLYVLIRQEIIESKFTFILLPSFNREACVKETVRRQLSRTFSRSAAREEQVIHSRFDLHLQLPGNKVETFRPPADVVADIVLRLAALPEYMQKLSAAPSLTREPGSNFA